MDFLEFIKTAFGTGVEPKDLTILQVCLRAAIVFLTTIVMVRVGNKRFLARMTPFDAIVAFMLGSVLARTINGSAPLLPTLGGGFLIILLHRFIATLADHSHRFGQLVKGREDVIIEKGQIHVDTMHRHRLTRADLMEELRLNGSVTDPTQVKLATLERSGEISVIK